MPPPRSATTACRSRPRGAWCRKRSRTAPRRSACAGSSAGWIPAAWPTATRCAPRRCSTPAGRNEKARFGGPVSLLFLFRGVAFLSRRQHLALREALQLLLDARLLAREAAQVIELGAAHVALALHL